MAEATLSTEEIRDWDSFHTVSAAVFGFPSFYGRNINAWVDCLSYLTDSDGMSRFTLIGQEQLFINIPGFQRLSARHPDIAAGLLDCVAAVNSGYIARDDIPRLALVPT